MKPTHPLASALITLILTFGMALGVADPIKTHKVSPAAIPDPPSGVPQLLAPCDGMEITDIASYFQWTAVPGCDQYEIQISSDPEFKELVKTRLTKDVQFHKHNYFPKDILKIGDYYWRVRAASRAGDALWSPAFRFKVNEKHSILKDLVVPLGPKNPLFVIRNYQWDPVKFPANAPEIIPIGYERTIIVDDVLIGKGTSEALERARKFEEMGINFVVWTNRGCVSLAWLEYLFQNFNHCVGAAEGEHFWSWGWERGPEGNISEWDYVQRAWTLCAKYGRYYFIGDGEAGNCKWTIISHDLAGDFQQYRKNIVPSFKSTVNNIALHSLGAVEGLLAAGWVENSGIWADEFVWGKSLFGKPDEVVADSKTGDRMCPYSYDLQIWLMGIVSGATAFHVESAHPWSRDGHAQRNYARYYLPFISAVVKHDLIPSRNALLESIKLAVSSDLEAARAKHQNSYGGALGFLNELYTPKLAAFQEIIPDNSRYGIVPFLPPAAFCIEPSTRLVPQLNLLAPGRAIALFNSAYPMRFEGDAFQWECDGTIIVTHSRENSSCRQRFSMPLGKGPARRISGNVELHQVLIGKVEKAESSIWFQANFGFDTQMTRDVPNPERILQVKFDCPTKPQVVVTPEAAKKLGVWSADVHRYTLEISLKDGPVEFELQR